eukprot:3629601-Pyramimonas_sp.AAC.1
MGPTLGRRVVYTRIVRPPLGCAGRKGPSVGPAVANRARRMVRDVRSAAPLQLRDPLRALRGVALEEVGDLISAFLAEVAFGSELKTVDGGAALSDVI